MCMCIRVFLVVPMEKNLLKRIKLAFCCITRGSQTRGNDICNSNEQLYSFITVIGMWFANSLSAMDV
jgi:hypothetical protein